MGNIAHNQRILNLAFLQAHLKRLDLLLSIAVEYARIAGFDPENEFQGLFISEEEIDRHLNLEPGSGIWGNFGPALEQESIQPSLAKVDQRIQEIIREAQQANLSLRLMSLVETLQLSQHELNILLAAAAPAIDRRYERIYGYLQDDVTKRHPTVNLIINLFGDNWPNRTILLDLLSDESTLLKYHLVKLVQDPSDSNAAMNSLMVKIDPQVVRYLQCIDSLPQDWHNFARRHDTSQAHIRDLVLDDESCERLSRDYGAVVPLFHLNGLYGSGRHTIAKALANHYQMGLLEIDLAQLIQQSKALETLMLIFREGHMHRSAIMLHHWEVVLDANHDIPPWLWDEILRYPYLVVLSSEKEWEPRGTHRQRPIVRINLETPIYQHRLQYWKTFLGESELNPTELAYKFKLTGGQIRDAVYSAFDLAISDGRSAPTLQDLYRASRSQSSRRLTSLAVKIKPRYTWDDIVLPDSRVQQLREICDQVKYAVKVYDDWGFKGRGSGIHGLTALFAGQSGTGKTMSAEIIASELGLELFKIDLSSVVSKYIGETEKNLATIFDEATQSNAILFFDEADALFGKRSEVKDSHDRYANIETGYLLQRMETYDGIAILASNLRQNLDEAFTRRLDFMIDFPFPEHEDRFKIWRVSFAKNAPIDTDVDLDEIANRYRMAGGNIRNAAMAAAFLAVADDSSTIRMKHVIHAIRREHQKMGKLLEDEYANQFL